MNTLVITGASKGIGLAAAGLFLEDGYRVINLSRTPAPLEGVENHSIDLAQPGAQAAAEKLLAPLVSKGCITLVHNAARLINDSAADTSTESFEAVLSLNVVAPHILNQVLIPLMEPGSSIIYVGSTLAEKAVPNCYSYVVSKHAMIGMMRATCQDLAGRQIHTACVCPGFTDTEMLREHVGSSSEILEQIAAGSTFGRLVTPAEIGATIRFAAAQPVLNGAVLHANLGQIES